MNYPLSSSGGATSLTMLVVELETMETNATIDGRCSGIDCLPPVPSMSHHQLKQQHHRPVPNIERPRVVLQQPPSTRSLPASASSCLKQAGSRSPRRQLLAKTTNQSSSRSVTFDEDAVTVHTILSASSLSSAPKSELFYSPRELEIMQENSIHREEERRYQEEQKLMFERKAQRARRKAEKKAKAERRAKRRSASGRHSCSEEDASHYSVQSLPVISRPPVIGKSGTNQRQESAPLWTRPDTSRDVDGRWRPPAGQKLSTDSSTVKLHQAANRVVQIYRPGESMRRPVSNTFCTGQVPSMHRIFPTTSVVSPNMAPVTVAEKHQRILPSSSLSSASSWYPPSQLDGAQSVRSIGMEETGTSVRCRHLHLDNRARYEDLQRSLSRNTIQIPPSSRDTPRRRSPRTLPDVRPSLPAQHHSLSLRTIQHLPERHSGGSCRPRQAQPVVESSSYRSLLEDRGSRAGTTSSVSKENGADGTAIASCGSRLSQQLSRQHQKDRWENSTVGLEDDIETNPHQHHGKSPSSMALLQEAKTTVEEANPGQPEKKKLWHRILCKGGSTKNWKMDCSKSAEVTD